MRIRQFDGGLNTRVAPSLLAENEAIIFSNIDVTDKLLNSVMEPLVVSGSEPVFGYFYNFANTWLSSAGQRSYVEYKDVLYWTEDNKKPKKFDGSRTSLLGIEGPTGTITVAQQNVLTAPASAPTRAQANPATTGISDDAETLTYCYTYYDSVQGRESPKSTSSTSISLAANKDVLLSDILASAETGVDTIRVYRTGDGIATMTLVLSVPNTTATITDSIRTANLPGPEIKAQSGISGNAETLQYCYTYYNVQDGVESIPSEISAEISLAANKDVLISGIVASTDTQVDLIRIYRIGDGVTEYTLVREIPNEGTTTFIDDIATLSLEATLLDSFNNYPPPSDLKYITEAYGIMFGSVGDKVRFSLIGEPDYWPPSNEIDFAHTITGLFPVPNGVLVFSRTKTDILAGTNSSNFAVLPISGEHGSVSHYSGKLVKNTPTWVSLDGISNYSGGVVRIVSKEALGKLSLNVVNTAVYNEEYYISLSDGTLLVMDTRFNISFKKYSFSSKIDNILTYDDILYARQGDNLVTLFNGITDAPFTYLSPVFTDGEHSNVKLYNNIYIRLDSAEGIIVKVFIDGLEVLYKVLQGIGKVHDITPPADYQRGTGIQFKLEGSGTVYEIDYKVVGRQNGR